MCVLVHVEHDLSSTIAQPQVDLCKKKKVAVDKKYFDKTVSFQSACQLYILFWTEIMEILQFKIKILAIVHCCSVYPFFCPLIN